MFILTYLSDKTESKIFILVDLWQRIYKEFISSHFTWKYRGLYGWQYKYMRCFCDVQVLFVYTLCMHKHNDKVKFILTPIIYIFPKMNH